MTLVEVIVVAAIIVLVIGVAVPGIVSLASLGRGDFGNSARNLLGALRAAKMYSATYRSITAVAYVYSDVYDSVLFEPATTPPQPAHGNVIEGFALVRRPVDRADAVKLAEAWITDSRFDGARLFAVHGVANNFDEQREFFTNFFINENIYFTLQNREGQFREFGRDAVILNAVPKPLEAFSLADVEATVQQRGLLSIRVIAPWSDVIPDWGCDGFTTDDGDGVPDLVAPPARFLFDSTGYLAGDPTVVDTSGCANFSLLPAHVFSPTGRVLMPSGAPERVALEVGPSPSLADAYRFGRDLSNDEISTTNADETGDPLSQTELSAGRRFLDPILIELYQSTGRVNMASEGM